MKSWASHRVIAVAAHLALLLAVCVPVASRVMGSSVIAATAFESMAAAGHVVLLEMTVPMSAGMVMPDGSTSEGRQHGHHPGRRAPMDACAYCSLFAHLPCVVAFAATLATLPDLPAPTFLAQRIAVAERPVHLAFRPRGPPTILALA